MAFMKRDAPWRKWITDVLLSNICAPFRWLKRRARARKHPSLTSLNRHYLHDIGVDPDDPTAKPHRLPSQHTQHPRG